MQPNPDEVEGLKEERNLRPCSLEEAQMEVHIVDFAVLVVVQGEVHIAGYTALVVARKEEHTVDSDEKVEVQKEEHNSDSTAKEAALKGGHTAAVPGEDQTGEHNPRDLEAAPMAVHTPDVYQEEGPTAAHTADYPVRNSSCYFAFAHLQV